MNVCGILGGNANAWRAAWIGFGRYRIGFWFRMPPGCRWSDERTAKIYPVFHLRLWRFEFCRKREELLRYPEDLVDEPEGKA